jgi:hypothetical protein
VTRRALVIGIDHYAHLPYPLEGCVNDAKVLGALLEDRFDFPAQGVVMLLDEQATRERILSELDRLVEVATEDDVVVVTYSGHGSQMTDREGDEADGLDETIVPHDSGRAPDPNRDISDDELYVRLLALTQKTPFVTLLFDCCHSGSVARDAFGERSRWIEADLRSVDELPTSTVPRELLADGRDIGPSGWLPLGERYVLIAGCRDDESSYEQAVAQGDGSVTHGALTYFLTRELSRAGPGATYRDVFELASVEVTATKPRQHPQMEGAADRELFGIRERTPMPFVLVGPRSDDLVALRAGLAHGATVGSRWAVYAPGTKEGTADAERRGTVSIVSVGAVTSDAKVIEEDAPGTVSEGCRAVEESHDSGDLRLAIDVRVPAGWMDRAARLVEGIGRSGSVRLVAEGEVADVRAYLVPARDVTAAGDPVPQIGPIAEPVWAVVGADGLLAMPLHPIDAEGVDAVLANLEKAARYRQVLSLRNPDADGVLQGGLSMRLLRLGPDGQWVEAQPDGGGSVVYREGDRIALEISNRHPDPVYVSVLDLGLAGAIEQLYPVQGAAEQLAATGSIRFGVRDGEDLRLEFPEGWGVPADPNDARPAEGVETFKLMATTSPADFRSLLQGGFRDAEVSRSPAEELMSLALGSGGSRDVARPVHVAPADAWVTVERAFILRRGRA